MKNVKEALTRLALVKGNQGLWRKWGFREKAKEFNTLERWGKTILYRERPSRTRASFIKRYGIGKKEKEEEGCIASPRNLDREGRPTGRPQRS